MNDEWMDGWRDVDRATGSYRTCGRVGSVLALSRALLHVLSEPAHLLLQVGAALGTRPPVGRPPAALQGVDVDLEAVQGVPGVVLQPAQLVLHPAARVPTAVSQGLDLGDDAVEVLPAVPRQGFDLTHVVAQVHHLQRQSLTAITFRFR